MAVEHRIKSDGTIKILGVFTEDSELAVDVRFYDNGNVTVKGVFDETQASFKMDSTGIKCAGLSEVATLDLAVITVQPEADTVTEGATATFTLTATGATSYQWQSKAVGGSWADISGETSNSHETDETVFATDNGKLYRCKAINAEGYVLSDEVLLTVQEAEAEGTVLFGDHFDAQDDWNTSQNVNLLTGWDQCTADNTQGGSEAGYIGQNGEASGKCLKQLWDTGTSIAQNCWLIKNSIALPDEFYIGYRFKVDTNWDWGSATSLKIMKLHYDNGATFDINWCSSHYGMPSPWTPPGGGYSIATDDTGNNWFSRWTDIDDGAWHTFIWQFKHSTGVLECLVDGSDAALTSADTAFPGTGWDDGTVSGYAISFGGNLSGGGGGVNEMWTKYDDVCVTTTLAKAQEYLGI